MITLGGDSVRFPDRMLFMNATIPNGAAFTDAIDLGGYTLIAVKLPAAWDAASIGIYFSDTGVTFLPGLVNGNQFSYGPGSVDHWHFMPSGLTYPCPLPFRYIKLVSGVFGGTVNQSADRILRLACLPVPFIFVP